MPHESLTTQAGLLADFEQVFAISRWQRPPDCSLFNSLWQSGAPDSNGHELQFVVQDANLLFPELGYAQRIARHGLIATRPDNWHDAFNALTWLLLPRTKLALTQRLAETPGTNGARHRTPEHDALTLFDECGVLLATTDPGFQTMHAEHDWHRLFVAHRGDFGRRIVPVVFGHGLCDQARNPYLGLTGKAWYLAVSGSWMALPAAQRYARLDAHLADTLPGTLTSPRQLLPLPILGVPGWWADNVDPSFYDNAGYFRPARHEPR